MRPISGGAVFHGSLSEEGWKWNEVFCRRGRLSFPPVSVDSSSRRSDRGKWPVPQFESAARPGATFQNMMQVRPCGRHDLPKALPQLKSRERAAHTGNVSEHPFGQIG